MSELILELFSEEIPAKIQKKFAEKLQALATNSLNNMGFLGELEVFVTPRRVAVLANNLTYKTGQNNNHIRGPKLNAHAKAIQGFLQKHNLQNIEQLTLKKVGEEEYYFFIKEFNSETIIAELTKILNKLILDIAKLWPKTMRWNSTNARWVRPLRNILCLSGDHQTFGSQPDAMNVFDIDSTNLIRTVKNMRDDGNDMSGFNLKESIKLFLIKKKIQLDEFLYGFKS